MFLYKDDRPEPHRIRRMELLKKYPELRNLYGFSYLTSALIVAIVAVQLAAAWLVQDGVNRGTWAGSLWFVVPLAYLLGGTFNHWAGMGMHEAAHNLVARTEVGNRIMAMVANIAIPVPSAMSFRRHHMKHHSHLGIFPDDNDLAMDFELNWVGRSAFRKFIWLVFYLLFATLARGFVRRLNRWELINMAVTLGTNALIVHFIGWTGLAYLGLSTFLGYGLHPAAAHFIHEHYVWKEGQETYSYYGPLNWVTFNVGYHNEHHDLMWIPGWKLPRVKAIAPEYYEPLASHRSWTWVLYHFIVNPQMGHDSRIIRSHDTITRPNRLFTETHARGFARQRLTTEEHNVEAAPGEVSA